MTQERDFQRLLDHWFNEGPTAAPDRVIDTVADRIVREHQRPAWRLRLNDIHVDRLRLALVAAGIVIALVLAGVAALGPMAVPAPTPTPSRSGPGAHIDTNNYFGLTFQNPGTWVTSIDGGNWLMLSPIGEGSVDGVAVFRKPVIMEQDPTCTAKAKVGVGHGVDDLVGYLTTHPGLVTSTPQPVTIGSLTGKRIDLHIAPTWTDTCPYTSGHTVMYLTEDLLEPEYKWGVDQTEYQRVAFLDAGAEGVIAVAISGPSEYLFQLRAGQAQPILESLQFRGVNGSASSSPSASP